MKMLKKVLIPVLLITALMLTFALTSCKKECAHEYGEWTVTKEATCTEDGEQERTCSSCGETETQTIKATGHSAEELLCGVCGETVVGVDSLLPSIDTESLSSVGVVIKDVVLTESDDDYKIVQTLELAELVVYLDENGSLAGYGTGTASLRYSYGDVNETETVSVNAFLENGKIYLSNIDSEQEYYSVLDIENYILQQDGVVEAVEMITALLPSVETWINESLLPCFGEFTAPEGVELPELNEATAKKALTKILDLFFKVETTENGVSVILDLSIIKEANDALKEKTVAELIDLLGGEGMFLQIQELIPTLLDFSVDDLIKFINLNLGVDIPKLLTALDELAVIITGSEEATFEMLVGLEGDIDAILADEEFLALDVKTLLMSALELTEETELIAFIEQVTEMLNTTTVYQLLEVSESDIQLVSDVIDGIIAALSYEITVDKTGKFVKAELKVNIPDTETVITANITAEKIYLNANDGSEDNNITVEIIPDYTPNPDMKKLAEIKEKLSVRVEINEEILASNDLLPIYAEDGTTIIGGLYIGSIINMIQNEDGSISFSAITSSVDISKLISFNVTGYNCKEKYKHEYVLAATEETWSYAVDAALAEEVLALDEVQSLYDACLWIVLNSEVEYVVVNSTPEDYSIEFSINLENWESWELIDSADHALKYDDELSVLEYDVSCGEIYTYVYVCEDCGHIESDEYVKEHGEEVVIASIEYNEESGTYLVGYDCACGIEFCTLNLTFKGDAAVTPKKAVGENGDPIDFYFAVESSGTYEITISDASGGGYLHWYRNNGYIDTSHYSYGESSSTTLYITSGEVNYFNLYFYSYEETNTVTVTFTMVDGNG